MQGFLDTSFFDILFYFLDFSCILLFDILFYFLGFSGILLFDILIYSLDFHVIYIFIYQMHLRIFLRTYFLSNMQFLMFDFRHIFPYYIVWRIPFFILISLFNWLSFLSWIIMILFFSIQIFLLLCWQSLPFLWTFNGTPGIDSAVNFWITFENTKSMGKHCNKLILYNFPMSAMYQILEELWYRNKIYCYCHLCYANQIAIQNHFPKLS